MNILYLGKYKKRFSPVIEHIKNLPLNSQILELCFGDIYVAEYCKKTGYRWVGVDINTHFVTQAQESGYDASLSDLTTIETLPKADICIMIGSLYHFHPQTTAMLRKMLKASNLIVISEPVSNLSSKKGLLGFLAKRAANAGKGHETFRYDANSFLTMLKKNSQSLNYSIDTTQHHGKDMVVSLKKTE